MRDKQGQQRRWRADGAIRSSVDRRPVGEDPALASSSRFAATRWTTAGLRPQGARRHFVDSAQRRSLAGFAGRVPLASDLLAQTARLGRARCLAQYLAGVSGRTQRTEATAVERVFPGRECCSRQKRGAGVGKTKRGKGTKWMVVVDGQGLPLGKHLCSASPHETQLAETTLAAIRVSGALRRYRRRWKVERTFAWLGNFRHLVVRYDRSLTIYSAFFHIACFMIVLRRVLK